MRNIALCILFSLATSVNAFSQNSLKDLVSEDGNTDIHTLYDPGFLNDLRRADQLQNLDPGVPPEGDYMGQAVFSPDGDISVRAQQSMSLSSATITTYSLLRYIC